MSAPWFRVPADCAKSLVGDHKATKEEATVDLLGRWHLGGEPSIGELRRAWSWSADRVIALRTRLAAWASANGAAVPESIEIGRRSDGDRTDEVPENADDSTGIGRRPDGDRTPRARDPLLEREMEMEISNWGGDASAEAAAEPMDLPALLNGDATLLAPLLAARIATVAELAAQTLSGVRMLPGIGPKRVIALHQALQRHGLAFRAEPMPKGKRETERPGLRDLQDRWCGAFRYVTGKDYAWTPRGRTSDGKAAADVYDAMGWSADPTPETVAAVKATVGRYLRHCQQANPPRVATLHDLARNLSSYRQDDALVDATRARVRVDASAQKEAAKMDLIGGLLTRKSTEPLDA